MEDPGWNVALRLFARQLVVPWTLARRTPSLPAIHSLRVIWLVLLNSYGLFLFVLGFVLPWWGAGGAFPWVVIGVGSLSLVRVGTLRRKLLDGTTQIELVKSYVKRFYQGFGVSGYPALTGFVGAFVQETRWIYALGLPFTVAGMLLSGPTRRNIARDEARLRNRGGTAALVDALVKMPPPGGRHPQSPQN